MTYLGHHKNGGGKIEGASAFISADSYVDSGSRISGESVIFNSSVIRSMFISSKSSQSTLENVALWDSTLHQVTASQVLLREVVAESCILLGPWTLSIPIHIHKGEWTQAPRSSLITGDNGVRVGLAECLPGFAHIGCICKPIPKLLKYGPKLGKKHNWTPEQITQAYQFFEMVGDTSNG